MSSTETENNQREDNTEDNTPKHEKAVKFNEDMHRLDAANAANTEKARKLPKGWRIANFIYQLLLLGMTVVNLILLIIDESNTEGKIPKLYFSIYACLVSVIPVAWSKILDYAKDFHAAEVQAESHAMMMESRSSDNRT